MRKLVIATAIIGVLLSPAFAQVKPRMLDEPVKCGDPNFKGTCPQTNEWPDGTTHQDLARVVPSGKEMRIYWIYMLNTDCSAKEEPSLDMRILSQPKHGKAEVTAFSSIASYAHADWKKCNGVKAPGMGIKYKSAEHFTGKRQPPNSCLLRWRLCSGSDHHHKRSLILAGKGTATTDHGAASAA